MYRLRFYPLEKAGVFGMDFYMIAKNHQKGEKGCKFIILNLLHNTRNFFVFCNQVTKFPLELRKSTPNTGLKPRGCSLRGNLKKLFLTTSFRRLACGITRLFAK